MSHWRVWPPEGRWSFPQFFFFCEIQVVEEGSADEEEALVRSFREPKNHQKSNRFGNQLNNVEHHCPKIKARWVSPAIATWEAVEWRRWLRQLTHSFGDRNFGRQTSHWVVVWTIFIFPSYWEKSSHLTHIFQRGRYTTNQLWTLTKPKSFPCHDMTTLL